MTTTATNTPHGVEIKIPGVGVTPVAISTTLPAAVAQLTQQGKTISDFPPANKPKSVFRLTFDLGIIYFGSVSTNTHAIYNLIWKQANQQARILI